MLQGATHKVGENLSLKITFEGIKSWEELRQAQKWCNDHAISHKLKVTFDLREKK